MGPCKPLPAYCQTTDPPSRPVSSAPPIPYDRSVRLPSFAEYGFYYGDNVPRKDLYIRDATGQGVCVAQVSHMKKGVPDVRLHSGSLDGVVLGYSGYEHWEGHGAGGEDSG